MGRFSQAIAEGDGISIVPILEGEVAGLAALAEDAGAEAVAVRERSEVEAARAHTALPIIVMDAVVGLGGPPPSADVCVLTSGPFSEDGRLENAHAALVEHGIDCVVEVR